MQWASGDSEDGRQRAQPYVHRPNLVRRRNSSAGASRFIPRPRQLTCKVERRARFPGESPRTDADPVPLTPLRSADHPRRRRQVRLGADRVRRDRRGLGGVHADLTRRGQAAWKESRKIVL